MSICVVDGKACRCQPSEGSPCPGVVALTAERDGLRAQVEALKADSARYQWLVSVMLCSDYGDNETDGWHIGWRSLVPRMQVVAYGPSINDAIDAILARGKP